MAASDLPTILGGVMSIGVASAYAIYRHVEPKRDAIIVAAANDAVVIQASALKRQEAENEQLRQDVKALGEQLIRERTLRTESEARVFLLEQKVIDLERRLAVLEPPAQK
jgi:ABC-type metal ion transport system substrate-binding protein